MLFVTKPMIRLLSLFTLFFFLLGLNLPAQASFSVGQERDVGEKLLSIIRKELKVLDDPDIIQYANRLGNQIVTSGGSRYFDYHFFVIDNKEFNAFAAPSGLIVIHSGLIEAMENEDELVSVLAHEWGHVHSRHIAQRMEQSTKVNLATMALIIAGIALGGGPGSEALIAGGMAAGTQMSLKFSRQDEEESDRIAFDWMRKAGRDTGAMVSMLRKMNRVSMISQGTIPPYLLTHPEPSRRYNYVQDLITFHKPPLAPPHDDFAFQRFRYRILSKTKEPAGQLPYYLKKAEGQNGKSKANPMLHYGISQMYLAIADFDNAEKSLNKVIAALPDKPILLTDLGVIALQSGDTARARELFEQVRKLDPTCAYTTFNLARLLQQSNHPAEALVFYESLLETLPTYARLYYHIGQIKTQLDHQGESHYYLGNYFWYLGQQDNAIYHLKEAVAKLPADHKTRQQAKDMLNRIDYLDKI